MLGVDGLLWSPMNRGSLKMAAGCTQDRDEAPILEAEVGRRSGTKYRATRCYDDTRSLARKMDLYFNKPRQVCDTKEERTWFARSMGQ